MKRQRRIYRYSAYTPSGAIDEGQLEAASIDEAAEHLWERGLTPFETREEDSPGAERRWGRSLLSPRRPSRRDVALFTREFATLRLSGMPLDDSLRIVAAQLGRGRMLPLVASLLQAVLDGTHLSEAMGRHPEVFEPGYVNMVRAGELSGDSARVLGELADLLERRQEIAGQMTSALIYPCILIIMALASVAAVMAVLVPNLATIFVGSHQAMPALVAFIIQVNDAWPAILAAVGIIGMGGLILAVAVSRSESLRRSADRMLLRLPLFGTLWIEQDMARFARTLGSLLRAGVPMLSALASARSVVRNSHITTGLDAALETIRDGQSLGRALAGRPGIPSVALQMISVGEQTGKLDQMLLRIAVMMERQSQRRIERLMTLLTPTLTILIAGLVGTLMLTVMDVILSVNELTTR